ncbi:MAG: hypothetical protein AB1797_08405 [bacterium]
MAMQSFELEKDILAFLEYHPEVILKTLPTALERHPELKGELYVILSKEYARKDEVKDEIKEMLTEIRAMREESEHRFKAEREELDRKLEAQKQELERKLEAQKEELERKLKVQKEELERKLKAQKKELDRKLKAEKEDLDRKLEAEKEELDRKLKAEKEELDRKLEAEKEERDRQFKADRKEFQSYREAIDRRFDAVDKRLDAMDIQIKEVKAAVGSLGRRSGINLEETILSIFEKQLEWRNIDARNVRGLTIMDEEGKVFGVPNVPIQVDMYISNGTHFLFEIKYAFDPEDIYLFIKKADFVDEQLAIKSKRFVLGLEISSKVKKIAESLEVEVISRKGRKKKS